MLPSNRRIGILGGGQLGKMLIEASRPWNTYNAVLESSADCPASLVADKVIEGSLYDAEKIKELASMCDVLTYEIEHVNVDALLELESEGCKIIPSPAILSIIQDKGRQKQFYTDFQIPTAPYFLVGAGENIAPELLNGLRGDKVVVKACRGGYDGKGVEIKEKSELLNADFQFATSSVIEEFQPAVLEVSVIVASDNSGETIAYDPVEMYFNPVSNLVEFLFSPAKISNDLRTECMNVAMKAVKAFKGAGLFAVELFADTDGKVLVNEIAPRPHNSGHHTIEGSYTSQFEQLNRILLDLPLGSPDMVCPAAMINLVGPEGLEGAYQLTNAETLLKMPGVYIHLYNKQTIRAHRKMGHITVLAQNHDALMEKAEEVRKLATFSALSADSRT